MPTTMMNPRIKQWVINMTRNKRIAHAYLFVGKKGAGKKQAALFFAQALFCAEKNDGQPCGKCSHCLRISHFNHPDVHWVQPEGLSIKIEQVRHLQKEFAYRSMETEQKVYVIEAVEMMTSQAANSLLKFLEEPHPGTVALLLTDNHRELLPTIVSRCQQVPFPPPDQRNLSRQLAKTYDASLAHLAAQVTSIWEEASALCQAEWFAELKELVIQLTEEVAQPSNQPLFLILDRWLQLAPEKDQTDVGLDLLLFWYKDVLYTKLQISEALVFHEERDRLHKQALAWTEERLTQGMTAVLNAKRKLQAHVHPQLVLEQLVLKLQRRA